MNRHKWFFIFGFIVSFSVVFAGCASASESSQKTVAESETESVSVVTPAFNDENQAYWREVIQTYRIDDRVGQILLVRCTEGSNAVVQFFDKQREQNNAWTLVFETDAYIGKYGAGKTQEGDAKTPIGDFGVLSAFGLLEDPGTGLDYIEITPTTYACDEEGEFYNRIIDTKATGHDCTGEEMFLYTPEYNYGIATNYNVEGEWPKGSAIFLHCKGAKVFTGGCVAIDEEHMKTVLQYAEPGMRIIINEEYADHQEPIVVPDGSSALLGTGTIEELVEV